MALLVPSWAWAAVTYIDPSCTNTGDGTVGSPCAASSGAVGPFKAWPIAPNITGADAQFLQKRGTTSLLQVVVNSGTDGHPVILGAYGTGAKPIIRAEDVGNSGTIKIATDAHDITIDGIEVHGATNFGAGIQTNAIRNNTTNNGITVNITVQNCTIGPVPTFGSSASDDGIDLRGRGLIVQDNTFSDIANDAVWLDTSTGVGTGPIIRRNTCSRVSQTGTNGDCYQIAGSGTGGLIEHNYCDHSDVDSKNCAISNDNVIIRYNEVHGPVGATVHVGIYCDIGTSCQIYGNKTYYGKIGIANYVASGTSLTHANVVTNPATNGIEVIAVGAIVNNNTVDGVSAGQAAIRMTSAATNAVARNNIVSDADRGILLTSGSGQTESNNMFHGTIGTRVYDTTVAGSIAATNSVVATGQFVNESTQDYRLIAGSTGRRAGLLWVGCQDLHGSLCQSPPDLGAYQSNASGGLAQTRTAITQPRAPRQ